MHTLTPLARAGKINPDASIRDSQSTIINAPIATVWEILSAVDEWPEWNQDIRILQNEIFKMGSAFRWQLNGIYYKSTIQQIRLFELISYTSESTGTKSIHVWRLDETEGDQTIVTTEMSTQGFLTLFQSHQKLHSTLLNWLSRLKQRAEKE